MMNRDLDRTVNSFLMVPVVASHQPEYVEVDVLNRLADDVPHMVSD